MPLRKSNKTTGLKFPSVTVTTIKKTEDWILCAGNTDIQDSFSSQISACCFYQRGSNWTWRCVTLGNYKRGIYQLTKNKALRREFT